MAGEADIAYIGAVLKRIFLVWVVDAQPTRLKIQLDDQIEQVQAPLRFSKDAL